MMSLPFQKLYHSKYIITVLKLFETNGQSSLLSMNQLKGVVKFAGFQLRSFVIFVNPVIFITILLRSLHRCDSAAMYRKRTHSEKELHHCVVFFDNILPKDKDFASRSLLNTTYSYITANYIYIPYKLDYTSNTYYSWTGEHYYKYLHKYMYNDFIPARCCC